MWKRKFVDLGGGLIGSFSGRQPSDPWMEPFEPFELMPQDARRYPKETGRVVDWIKGRNLPSFTRHEAANAARSCGLIDRQHRQHMHADSLGLPRMYPALEILEVYDYIRTFFPKWRQRDEVFIVNPMLLDSLAPTAHPRAYERAFDHEQKRELWFRAGGRCCICRVRLGPDWHADHIIPWSKGGLTVVENGAALCPTCNARKSAKVLTVDED